MREKRKSLFGIIRRKHILRKAVTYALLISIGFVYLYPVLYMISTGFMSMDDLLDGTRHWIPRSWNLDNFRTAAASMDYGKSLGQSILLAGLPTVCGLFSCSLAGYGLARYDFSLKNVVVGVILISWILPDQITMIPIYVLYGKLGILHTVWAFVLPALLAQGLHSSILILIFWQFFRRVPKTLLEAAAIDGAGPFRTFFTIAVPSAAPAYVVVTLFSFVWYWNESYLTSLYVHGVVTDSGWSSLMVRLSRFAEDFNKYAQTESAGVETIQTAIHMAGMLLSILPLLLFYLLLQKSLPESIDQAGSTGE